MRREISNSDDVVDSRDVIKRIDELEDEKSDLQTALDELKEELAGLDEKDDHEEIEDIKAQIESAEKELKEWDESDEGEELEALKAIQDECEGYSDWRHGESLIRDSYFKDYARQLAEDLGDISGDEKWPLNCIDWDKAAEELQVDYTSIEWDDVTYWIRCS